MDAKLVGTIPKETTRGLLCQLWGNPITPTIEGDLCSMQPYFQYYSTQCRQFLLDGGMHVSVSTHNDVVSLANIIRQDRERSDVLQCHTKAAHTDAANCSINLCARLLLMVAIGEPPNGLQGPNTIHWDIGTLAVFTERCFGVQHQLSPENAQISKMLTVVNLQKIGGLEIEWTWNLADHLRLVDDDRKILVFRCVSYLNFQNKHFASRPPLLFPAGFLDETLRTFSLLFPQNDAASQKWLGVQIKSQCLDPALLRCGSLWTHERRYENFKFWNNRLVILKQALNDARPQNLTQWWHDRRNGVQWYTFWVAILVFVVTIFFGIVQSLEGALQVWLSWKSMEQS